MRLLHVNEPTPHRVFPMRALLVTLAIAVGLSYWLVPDQNELVERLIKDHQYERVRDTLSAIGSKVDPIELRKLPREDLTLLTTLARLTPRERLNVVFSEPPPRYNTFIHTMILADIRYVDVIQPSDAWKMIQPHRTRIGGDRFIELSTVLAHNALSIAKPGLAADIFSLACEMPESTAQTAQELGTTQRWSGKPLRGAQQLRAWLKQHASVTDPIDQRFLSELCSTLAIEGNDPSLALDVVDDEIKRLPASTPPTPSMLDRAQSYATQCNRTAIILPWLQRYVASLSQSRLALKALHESSQTSTREYQRWTAALAQVADWNSAFDVAFEQHLRLAALGNLDSLLRCVALSDFLGRDDETVEALSLVGDVPGKPELKLTRADMLASLGRDEEAQPLYEAWLGAHPGDRDVAFALACLLEDEGEEDKAMAAFADIVKRHPSDVPAVKKLAENYIRADRHADALRLYEKLAERDHDHYTRENFAMLAESLDNHEALLNAQLLIARHDDTTEAWLDIAETAAYLTDKAPALAAMTEGLKHQPSSHGLRLAIAQLHAESEEIDEAVAVLMHDCVKSHQPAMEALLGFATEARNGPAILQFVGQDLEKRFQLSTQSRLDLAVLCALSSESERSERLFDSVPATLDFKIATAEARYAIGQYEQAAQVMNDYLKGESRATSDDWVFLGDIYDAMGLDENARQAYNHSLTLLTADLPANQTTSSLTRPPQPPNLPTP